MDLNTTPVKQLEQHIQWLRVQAQDDSPPSSVKWEEQQEALRDHALFLENFVLRAVQDKAQSRALPTFLRGRGANWEAAKEELPDESSATMVDNGVTPP